MKKLLKVALLAPRIERRNKLVVFFDGECGLCNRVVNLLVRQDKNAILTFASLQSTAAKGLPSGLPDGIIVADDFDTSNPFILHGSKAIFRILDTFGGVWRVASLLRLLPRSLTDFIYYKVAGSRYKWFGKVQHCELLPKELRIRLLE